MQDEEEDYENEEDESEDFVSSPIPMPPSAEVPRSNYTWLIALVVVLIAGYPLVGMGWKWYSERRQKEIEKDVPLFALECRPVTISTADPQGQTGMEITQACLDPRAWDYYTGKGLANNPAAMLAGIDYLKGEQPWKK